MSEKLPPRVGLHAVPSAESNGNGPDTPRAARDLRADSPPHETQADRLERVLLETHGMIGHLARDVSVAREVLARDTKVLHADLDSIREHVGVAIEAVRTDVAAMRTEMGEIGKTLGLRRTYSGSLLRVSMPPSTPAPLEIETRTVRTGTGEHRVITDEAVARLQGEWAEIQRQLDESKMRGELAEAEARGAAAAVERLEGEKAAKLEADKVALDRRSKRVELARNSLVLAALVFSIGGGIANWFQSHYRTATPAVPTHQGTP